uniref:Uncharacterized protein n=1 Tax=Anguilla anguilla TaxID=7936 RepID=A0A0E9U7G3_ANGAN
MFEIRSKILHKNHISSHLYFGQENQGCHKRTG